MGTWYGEEEKMSEDEVQKFMRKHPVSKWCESFSPTSMIIHEALKRKKT